MWHAGRGDGGGGVPEQIEDGRTGALVPREGAEAMAEAVVRLLGDGTRLTEMGSRAAEVARRQYDLDRHVDDYRKWFVDVLDDEGTARGAAP